MDLELSASNVGATVIFFPANVGKLCVLALFGTYVKRFFTFIVFLYFPGYFYKYKSCTHENVHRKTIVTVKLTDNKQAAHDN